MARFLLRYQTNTVMLAPGEFTLGRGPDCSLQLDDTEVSRRHAVLHVLGDKIRVQDLGSRNGIYVNGARVEGTIDLAHGDVLTIGKQTLYLIEEDERQRRAAMSTVGSPHESDNLRSALREAAQRELAGRDVHAELEKLSPREVEVLRLVALGHTQKEIGDKLGVSVKTVETYRTRINTKMGFGSRAELVQFALAAGFMEPSGAS